MFRALLFPGRFFWDRTKRVCFDCVRCCVYKSKRRKTRGKFEDVITFMRVYLLVVLVGRYTRNHHHHPAIPMLSLRGSPLSVTRHFQK